MKKNLLKVLLTCLILFSLTACGGAKKDPEVVKKIIGIVKEAVDYYNVPQKDIEITSSSNFMDMDKKEQELAKNIKIVSQRGIKCLNYHANSRSRSLKI